jgi:dCMP deaminase
MNKKWDLRFLELAKHISGWSKDPSTKVGSVIVDDLNRIISMGYNGFPRHFNDREDLYADRETKLKYVCHAERNALDNAPCSVRFMTLYCTHPPCLDCQKSIVQNGIQRVVCYNDPKLVDRWGLKFTILQQAGIELKGYNCDEAQV